MVGGKKHKTLGWKRPVAAVLCIAGIAAVSVVGYRAYQSHLSSDLRRTLAAALSPGASIADVRTYQSDARRAVHTRKDREVDAKFERLAALVGENCDAQESAMKAARKAATESLASVAVDRDDAPPVQGSEVEQMDDAVNTAHNAFERYLACEARVNRDRQALPGMMDDLRMALGGAGPAMLPK